MSIPGYSIGLAHGTTAGEGATTPSQLGGGGGGDGATGGREFTFYFAWCSPNTPWDISLARFDENIFNLVVEHDEGQIPTATIEIVNPRVGFISPSRLYWAWFGFSYDACGPLPLFFGRLMGIPEEIRENTVRMKFIARDTDYIKQKQRVAETLKAPPNYDEIFLDVMKRDDPDTILEGWSALYHVDRLNGRVSASDILVGEDGTVHFAGQDVFYDSVKCKILQSPLKAVNVKMEVHWAQQTSGHMYIGQWAYPTIGNEPFVGDWPKTGAGLGGGWSVGVAWAGERDPAANPAAPFNIDTALINQKPSQISTTWSWTNTAKKHRTGDTMSVSVNYTQPFGETIVLKEVDQFGIVNPYAVDINGDPAPINIPAHVSIDWLCYKPLALRFDGKQALATLGVCYNMDRKWSERLEMTIQSDVQPVLIDPLVTEDTEEIILKSGDISLPFIEMLNWDSVGGGQAVAVGQFIFPDNPIVAGQTSSQICVQGGNTGMEEPIFSNIPGQTTVDGTVVWASIGDTPPTDTAQDWQPGASVGLGTLIVPRPVQGIPDMESLSAPGKLTFPPTGIPVALYSMYAEGYNGPGAFILQCSRSGLVGGSQQFGEQAGFTGFSNPTGQFMYIAMTAGVSGFFHPSFDGGDVSDGGVHWKSLGPVTLPIGGWPGNTPASAYFPTDRGQQSLQYGMNRARAKLRKRARAVEVRFETRFEVAAMLSCRMNGAFQDPRLPGTTVFGKVISYKLIADGDEGKVYGSVVLGCSIGKAPLTDQQPVKPAPSNPDSARLLNQPWPVFYYAETPIGLSRAAGASGNGVPVYVKEGYVKPGYQRYLAVGTTLTPGDPNWLPPGTLGALYVVGAGSGASGQTPPPPASWPASPPTLPPETCPPLASFWTAGPWESVIDLGYTPPASANGNEFDAFGNGLLLGHSWHGMATHVTENNITIHNLQIEQAINDAIAASNTTKNLNLPSVGGVATGTQTIPVTPFYDIQVAVQIALLQKMPQGISLWFEMSLAPVTNGPFANAYTIGTTPLSVVQGIDLSAPSSGG